MVSIIVASRNVYALRVAYEVGIVAVVGRSTTMNYKIFVIGNCNYADLMKLSFFSSFNIANNNTFTVRMESISNT